MKCDIINSETRALVGQCFIVPSLDKCVVWFGYHHMKVGRDYFVSKISY